MIDEIKNGLKIFDDFPKKGVRFVDISPIFNNKKYFDYIVDKICGHYEHTDIDKVVSIESRGFVLGSVIAHKLGAGFVMIRKKGKLPGKVISKSCKKEYGNDVLEIQTTSIQPNENVLLFDDVLATGGTLKTSIELLKELNANIVGVCCLIELEKFAGIKNIGNLDVFSIIKM